MKKLVLIFTCLITLAVAGCNSDYTPQDKTHAYKLSESLSDCSITELKGYGENDIVIVRCPLSNTTTSYSENCGKSCSRKLNNNVIDENKKKETVEVNGIKYEKVEDVK